MRIEGRVKYDAPVRHTKTGKAVLSFKLEDNDAKSGIREFEVSAWEELAIYIGNLRPGMPVSVVGELRGTRTYKKKDDSIGIAYCVNALSIVHISYEEVPRHSPPLPDFNDDVPSSWVPKNEEPTLTEEGIPF